jgi:mannose-6-phosphate isomerase-like protein (cupin superfamily)
MNCSLPHKIKNHLGEELIFHRTEMDEGEEKLIIENYVAPDTPPIKHTFYQQDEWLVVLHGKMGYQIKGQEVKYAGIGETVFFKRGVPHKFWNAGKDELNCFGWIKPANNIIFYLESLYNSINETGSDKPDQFDSAFLLFRYGKEFDIPEIPKIVKKLVLPATYGLGKITGKYKKFKNAPAPLAT